MIVLTNEIGRIRIILQDTSEDCQEALAARNISDRHDESLEEK